MTWSRAGHVLCGLGLVMCVVGCRAEEPAPPAPVSTPRTEPQRLAAQREMMVRTQIQARGVKDERVLAAMRKVPREEFVPEDQRPFAFEDRPEAAPAPRIPSAFLDRFTELRGEASLSDARGDRLRAGFLAVGAGGSGTLLAGIDPLFDLRPAATDATASASAGARVVAGAATLGYDVLFPGRAAYVPACAGGGGERRVEAWQPQQHAASAEWDSPCRCFRIAAVVRVNDCGDVSYSASIDLSRLGEARALR